MLKVVKLDHVRFIPTFLRNCHFGFHMVVEVCTPSNSGFVIPLFHILHSMCVIDLSHYDRYKTDSQSSFDLEFSDG